MSHPENYGTNYMMELGWTLEWLRMRPEVNVSDLMVAYRQVARTTTYESNPIFVFEAMWRKLIELQQAKKLPSRKVMSLGHSLEILANWFRISTEYESPALRQVHPNIKGHPELKQWIREAIQKQELNELMSVS